MSIEQRTRVEVIHALATIADALRMLLQERDAEVAPAKIEDSIGEPPPVIKKARKAKAEAKPQPEPLGPPLTSEHEMNEPPKQMADIKPTKPGKTLADLRVALQECINKHGMPGAKERLAPFAKISDVPDDKIAAVIDALAA